MTHKLHSRIAVVIPCYKVGNQILNVITNIPSQVNEIIVIDDNCPEKTGEIVKKSITDPRVKVIINEKNLGVGGATKIGYLQALKSRAEIIIKVDGDGQVDPGNIGKLIQPIIENRCAYAKGNRFYSIKNVRQMPMIRKIGNIALSFISKLSTGYYEIFDPNNGFTAISRDYLSQLPLDEIDNRYFFESDMLFQMKLLGAIVEDVSLPAIYADEHSSLSIWNSFFLFSRKHFKNFVKRIIYTYYLRDFNIASIQLLLGIIFITWGGVLGFFTWFHNMKIRIPSPPGTIVFVAILLIIGLQLLLSFLNFDMRSQKNRNTRSI
jgi:glycosyltransferase involved in cell wall biosynthesis